jgi:hypothetical protein
MSRVAQGGQAAVESIGIAVLVALLLAAVSAWLVREVRPPDRPPAFIEAVSKPLVRDPAPFEFRYPMPRPFTMARGRDDEPIGRAVHMLVRGAKDGVLLGYELQAVFALAYAARLGERGEELLRNPLGGLVAVPELPPEGTARRADRDGGRLMDYVRTLRSMSPREAARKVSGDLGTFGADLSIEALEALLRKRLQRVGQKSPAS